MHVNMDRYKDTFTYTQWMCMLNQFAFLTCPTEIHVNAYTFAYVCINTFMFHHSPLVRSMAYIYSNM